MIIMNLPKTLELLIFFNVWLLENTSSMYSGNQQTFLNSSPQLRCVGEKATLFVTDGTKIVREEIQVRDQKMNLDRHIIIHIFV